MKIEIHITTQPIVASGEMPAEFAGLGGAFVAFSGIVRDVENGQKIAALEYESYSPMAEKQVRQILESLAGKYPCLAARVIHRIGIIPVGETAIQVGVVASHRGEAFALVAEFMNRLKQDVPIWKCRALSEPAAADPPPPPKNSLSLDAARAEIIARCQPLPAICVPLDQAAGHTLRETVCAAEDVPSADRSTRDGFAILENDPSETFQIVDTLHAADWKPRQLKTGEAVRVATGSSLPGENLRVLMQEDVERAGDTIRVVRRETAANLRRRGEEMRAGDPVLPAGAILNAGQLALLASAGCVQPRVSPRLKVVHFTTGDEVVPPGQTLQPGQIRDSNSILIRRLLESHGDVASPDLFQQHLPENFERAKAQLESWRSNIEAADLLLVSGGASVGEKDFTRALLEHLGFGIVFSRLNLRPGAPLIFGVNGPRAAFGLPGNPLAHFVCYHLFVATALAGLRGARPPRFLSGALTTKLDEPDHSRDTFWPARYELPKGRVGVTPLLWRSSGDLTCLATANALIRVPARAAELPAGAMVEFLPVNY